MYENGVRVKGYSRKQMHKRKLKTGFLKRMWGYPQYKSYEDYLANHKPLSRYSGWRIDQRYWRKVYVTGSRRLAKEQTNRKIRRTFRDQIQKAEYDNIPACRGADYQKYYDYMWTIW